MNVQHTSNKISRFCACIDLISFWRRVDSRLVARARPSNKIPTQDSLFFLIWRHNDVILAASARAGKNSKTVS
jgi:hypothetical protein